MQATMLIALRGAPLSILVALSMFATHAGVQELAATTGYNRKTAAAALATLAAMGLAERSGPNDHWRLPAEHIQLPLFTPSTLEHRSSTNSTSIETLKELIAEGYNLHLAASSSGSNTPSATGEETTTTTAAEGKILPLVRILTERTGIPAAVARRAVSRALSRHDPPDVEAAITAWLAFARDRPTITNPGAFVCARLRDNQDPPDDYNTAFSKYVPRGYEDLIEH